MPKQTKNEFISRFLSLQKGLWKLFQDGNEEMIDRMVDMQVKVSIAKGKLTPSAKQQEFFLFTDWGQYIDEFYAFNKEAFDNILRETEKQLKEKIEK